MLLSGRDDIGENSRNLYFSIAIYALIFLLAGNLIRTISTGSADRYISFGSFLDFLANIPSYPIQFTIQDFVISGDWGIFEFLRGLINLFTTPLGMLLYISNCLQTSFYYILNILSFLMF